MSLLPRIVLYLALGVGAAATVPGLAKGQQDGATDQEVPSGGATTHHCHGSNVILVPPGYVVVLSGTNVVAFPSYPYSWWWYTPGYFAGYLAVPYVANPSLYYFPRSIFWLSYAGSDLRFRLRLNPLLWQGPGSAGFAPGAPLNVSRRDIYLPKASTPAASIAAYQWTYRPPSLDRAWGH